MIPIVLDPSVRRLAGGTVLLGDQGRLVRLSPAGPAALARLATGGPAPEQLGRQLVDAGLAHPRPGPGPVSEVTVVIPVRDRAEELGRCLSAVGGVVPVLVVDDGSVRPDEVARVCRRHGARLLRREANGGPAAARNAGLAATDTTLVAFLDSDCTPPAQWLALLTGHFDDPLCAAVAPRVRARSASSGLLQRYALARGPLDLGPRPAPVRPGASVAYVPTAALVVRREALAAKPFDEALRYGEDVDLVWRLHDAGWRVRYDPGVVVRHDEPRRWLPWLVRRSRYGTSAAPLAQRHGARLTHLVLPPWPTAAWLLLVTGHPAAASFAAAAAATRPYNSLRRAGLDPATSATEAASSTRRTIAAVAGGLGGAGLTVTAPLLLLATRRHRIAALTVLLAPPLREWAQRRPGIDPLRWCALRLVDDLAYAAGVWRGCLRLRDVTPLKVRSSLSA